MIKCSPLFSVPFIEIEVKEDTNELKECTDILPSYFDNTAFEETDKTLRVLERYPNTKNILLNYFNEVAYTRFRYKEKFDISTSWITKTTKGNQSDMHLHRNCFYSAVYYFDEYDKDCASLEFRNPLSKFSSYYLMPLEHNQINSSSVHVKPRSKLLLFFPSYMEHRVLEHKGSTDRYSLAFNLVPTGRYGSVDSTFDTSWID